MTDAPAAVNGLEGRPASSWRASRSEVRALLRLAAPVIVAEIGWMSMGLVDTLMVGRLGPEAIGSVGLGGVLFMVVTILGMGLLLGLDTLVSQSFGARRVDECHRWLGTGLVLAFILAGPMTAFVWWGSGHLTAIGLHPDVERLTAPYLRTLSWGLWPLLCYAAFRRYLQGMSLVRPTMFALISANVVNAVGNWALIYGHLGLPAMGVVGSAWATNVARLHMALVLLTAIVLHDRRLGGGLWEGLAGVSLARLKRLIVLGGPAALQLCLEFGVFAAASAMAGTLTPVALASHQIAINVIALVFMVPLGMASAGAVLVGQHIGRQDPAGAGRAGWAGLVTVAGLMIVVALVFLVMPRLLLIGFTRDPAVLALGSTLLAIAAVFQLFDGLQVVATGALRGLGDTRTPMIWNVVGHWGAGLPVGWWLCFGAGLGVLGVWIGLSVGLTFVGIVLVIVWHRRVRTMVGRSTPGTAAAG